MLPPTIHPDTGAPYRWSGSESLEDLQPHELPTLPADIAERITAALLPLGYRPEPPPHDATAATAATVTATTRIASSTTRRSPIWTPGCRR